jgi:hypothetical protein
VPEAPTALTHLDRVSRSFASRLAPSSSAVASITRMMQTQRIAPHAERIAGMSFLSSSASLAKAREVSRMMQTLRIAPHVGRIAGMSFLSSSASLARAREVARISDLSSLSRSIGSASIREAHRITTMSLLPPSAHAKLMSLYASAIAPKMLLRFPEPPVYRSSPRLRVRPLRSAKPEKCPVCEHNEHVAAELDREPDGNIGYRLGRFQEPG